MKTLPRLLLLSSTLLAAALASIESAHAACTTSSALKAYGDWWIKRTASTCACEFWADRIDCGATGGYRAKTPTLITTLAGTCGVDCRDTSGYAAAVATVMGKYAASSGNYECDSSFVDKDGDLTGVCIDENDRDPRVWAKHNASETTCDGWDNDNDGTIDDGFTPACDFDQKRLHQSNLFQGNALGRVHLVDGSLSRTETDVVVEGPYAPLAFTRTFNSKHLTAEAGLGVGWTHSFAIYLQQLAAGDDRWRVLTPSGEAQYFRCTSFSSGAEQSCANDDHRSSGSLRRTSNVWYWYPNDGSVVQFSETVINGRRLWSSWKTSAGLVIATATADASGRVQQVTTANTNIFLYFVYGTYGLSAIRLSSTTGNQILSYSVGSTSKLANVKFAATVGTIDTNNYVAYAWDSGSYRLFYVQTRAGNPGVVTNIAKFTYDTSGRVTQIQDPTKDLSFGAWNSVVDTTTVTFNVDTGNTSTVIFTHKKGLWVTARNSDIHNGGMAAKTQAYDEHGRVTCMIMDDGRIQKLDYTNSRLPIRTDFYGPGGSCASPGSVLRSIWYAWEANNNQSMRPKWVHEKSSYYSSGDCSLDTLAADCSETRYFYQASDDRIQTIQLTGKTRLINDTIQQQVRKQRFYYFGIDTSVCTSGDSYPGLPCQIENQDGSGTVYTRSTVSYYASGANAGLVKTSASHDKTADPAPHITTYAGHNLFGTPLSVTDPVGMVTTYAANGWNAITQVTQTGALLDATSPPAASLSPVWQYSYTQAREVDTVTLPKGNKIVYKYWTTSDGFGRVKASATADSSGNLLEIQRHDYDKFGNGKQAKTLDSINGSTPCADENCTTYDVFRDQKFDANHRLLEGYLHMTSSGVTDATKYYTYTGGRLTQVQDYKGVLAQFTFDGLGRIQTSKADAATGGIQATTFYGHDARGNPAWSQSPGAVMTTTEHDDFGQLVLERSKTRGDQRFEYNPAGFKTKRQWSAYNSSANAQSTCYTVDWLGRKTKDDPDCDVNGATWLYYDGDWGPAGACPSASKQKGRLSTITDSNGYFRAMCYHPNGQLFAAFQMLYPWSNNDARGTTQIFDLNGNLERLFLYDRPVDRTRSREVRYFYDTVLKDRVKYVAHKLNGAGSYTLVTSDTTSPTYFAFGGFKTLPYANGVTETNTRNMADWLTMRRTSNGGTLYTDVNLTYDVGGNIVKYDDDLGFRDFVHHAAYDNLYRLRCASRTNISSCSGSKPWADTFNESFDYDQSGNRTNRRYGHFVTAEEKNEDSYTYIASSDVIDSVTSGGAVKQMSSDHRGLITEVSQPETIQMTHDADGHMTYSNDQYLGANTHMTTMFGDRYAKVAPCNQLKTWYYPTPGGGAGTSHEISLMDSWNTCGAEYPRTLRGLIYAEGRPLAVAHATVASAGAVPTEGSTYWVHTDHLGTPVLVTQSDRTDRWRWENDPFGRSDPVEYTVSSQAVSPADDPPPAGSGYTTCCCTGCAGGCGQCNIGCSSVECTHSNVWTHTYSPASAANVRVHFVGFDLHAEGTTTLDDDYVELVAGGQTIDRLTGARGTFWSRWSGTSALTVNLWSDNTVNSKAGFTIDKVEYITDSAQRYVLDLRFAGQFWENDAKASYNFQRWYRREDGRYLTPDPIGLAGGEPGYFAYVNSNPLARTDPTGLMWRRFCEPDTYISINGGPWYPGQEGQCYDYWYPDPPEHTAKDFVGGGGGGGGQDASRDPCDPNQDDCDEPPPPPPPEADPPCNRIRVGSVACRYDCGTAGQLCGPKDPMGRCAPMQSRANLRRCSSRDYEVPASESGYEDLRGERRNTREQ